MIRRSTPTNFALIVEWTNYCNLSCNMCPLDIMTRPKAHMSLEMWQKILDDCVANRHVVSRAYHMGEPLLWKHFKEGMKMWKDSGLSAYGWISTNGHLLDDDKISIIQDTPLRKLKISLDTMRPDVYKALRNNDNHQVVIDNINKLITAIERDMISIQLMRTSLNQDETIADFHAAFGQVKVETKKCTDIGKRFEYTSEKTKIRSGRACSKVYDPFCTIGADGRCGLCCPDYDYENLLGNIQHGTISEIFNGEHANIMRHRIKHGDYSISPHCRKCMI